MGADKSSIFMIVSLVLATASAFFWIGIELEDRANQKHNSAQTCQTQTGIQAQAQHANSQ